MAWANGFSLGQYLPLNSVIHKTDPRVKFLITLLVLFILLIYLDLKVYFLIFLFLLSLSFLSKIPFFYFWRNLKSFIWLFVFILLLHLLLTSGTLSIYFSCGIFLLDKKELIEGITYALRFFLFVFSATWLSLTTSPVDLTDGIFGLFSFLKKIKVPVQELALMTMIALRFIPLLLEEAQIIKKAQISRGASFEGGWIKKVKSSFSLILPLFIISFKKADDLALALEARGFASGQKRTSYLKLQIRKMDLVFAGLIVMVIFFSIFLANK
jgi:energy-coupling factor transport system permease protein